MTKKNIGSNYRPPEKYRSKIRELCDRIVDHLVPKCNELGWCISVHGSKERDLDVIAVPWTIDAVSIDNLLDAVVAELGVCLDGTCHRNGPESKVNGRVSYCFYINSDELVECEAGAFPYVDMSILDLRQFL